MHITAPANSIAAIKYATPDPGMSCIKIGCTRSIKNQVAKLTKTYIKSYRNTKWYPAKSTDPKHIERRGISYK